VRLPRFGKDWRLRWMQTGWSGELLHRVYALDWNEDTCEADGVTACGQMDVLRMPGLLSRMAATRCPICCDIAGVPRGNGAPFNQGIDA
jgi:hypothetical protein